jgi:NAD+ synthase (glutamine-hydrolysing)
MVYIVWRRVYELAHYLNRNGVVIPENTITKAPSAELREGQKDSDSLPDYSILDPLLYALNEGGQTPEQLIEAGYNKADVERIVSLRRGAAFKVAQIPPIFNVSEKPLVYKEKCLL